MDIVIQSMDRNKASIDKVILGSLNILPCASCYCCGQGGNCAIDDDMRGLYARIKQSDIIILASPIYFGSVSSVAKTMIDRCQAFWAEKYMAGKRAGEQKKRGYFIATAGSNDIRMLQAVKYTVQLFFSACGAAYCGDLLAYNTDNIKVSDNEEIKERAAYMGRNITL